MSAQTYDAHRAWLAEIVRQTGARQGAEIGIKAGRTLDILCSEFRELTMLGVDDWRPRTGYMRGWHHKQYKKRAYQVASKHYPRIYILEDESLDAAQHVPDRAMEFVFIDADHRTESVIRDVRAWRPKVKVGGILCGDDASKVSVRNALDECAPGWQRDGRCWWVSVTGGEHGGPE